jgi:hypothetical protein
MPATPRRGLFLAAAIIASNVQAAPVDLLVNPVSGLFSFDYLLTGDMTISAPGLGTQTRAFNLAGGFNGADLSGAGSGDFSIPMFTIDNGTTVAAGSVAGSASDTKLFFGAVSVMMTATFEDLDFALLNSPTRGLIPGTPGVLDIGPGDNADVSVNGTGSIEIKVSSPLGTTTDTVTESISEILTGLDYGGTVDVDGAGAPTLLTLLIPSAFDEPFTSSAQDNGVTVTFNGNQSVSNLVATLDVEPVPLPAAAWLFASALAAFGARFRRGRSIH